MPIELSKFKTLDVASDRAGGKKVDWNHVSTEILKTGNYYTVKEVHVMVEQKVTAFRCKGALDKLCEKGILSRRYDGKRFWYGKPF